MPGPNAIGKFKPMAADFDFVMYVIPSCSETGFEPTPLAATYTVGHSIDMEAARLIMFQRYDLVITALTSAGPKANGSLTFTPPFSLAIDPDP